MNSVGTPPCDRPDVVVSQVYGGGGNSGANLTNDYIELYNRGTATIDVTGWSVQYASSAGSSWQVTPLTGSIAPNGRYLVQEAGGSGATTPLPTAAARAAPGRQEREPRHDGDHDADRRRLELGQRVARGAACRAGRARAAPRGHRRRRDGQRRDLRELRRGHRRHRLLGVAEAMRVPIDNPQVVGPTNNFGETPVVPRGSKLRTTRGDIVIRPRDFNPERVVIGDTFAPVPVADVGDSYAGAVTGVIEYSFGLFNLLAHTNSEFADQISDHDPQIVRLRGLR